MSKVKAIIFSAPSGSGKSTIVHHLLKKYPRFEFSISATTREPRGDEKHGADYYFLSVEEFKALINNDLLVEYEEVYPGRFYGTKKSELERIWEKGNVVIFDVDVVGGVNLKKYFGDQASSIFIKAPDIDSLRKRLNKRGTDSQDEIGKRLEKASWEMTFESQFDHVIVNDHLDQALSNTEEILNKILN